MATRSVATVIGGSGFIGRYVVKRLAAEGRVVRVAVRDPEAARFLKPMGAVGQVVPLSASVTEEATLRRAIAGADVVINLVGILAEQRPGDFARIQTDGAGLVARICAEEGVAHLVHLSAIGADPASPSLYAASKGRGEQAVLAAFPAAAILRPSLVFGPEDQFFNRFAGMARMLPVMPVFFGDTRFQPVYVADVADAVLAVLARADAAGVWELGGPVVWRFRDLIAYVVKQTGRRRLLLDVPPAVARLQASVMERIPGKPLTRDQLLLLERDNIVTPGARGLAELGLVPTPIEMVVPSYLMRFRPGGGKRSLPPLATP